MSSASGSEPTDDRLTLLSEELTIGRRRVPGETVRVQTVTREVERDIDEALTHERVEIERVPIERVVEVAPDVREEDGVTIFPVVEETIVVVRRLVLKEEVRIRRFNAEGRHTETVLLRQQEAIISRKTPDTLDASQVDTTSNAPTIGTASMQETIVAIYDTAAHAEAAIRDLQAGNVPANDISQHAKGGSMTGTKVGAPAHHEQGFWASLFGTEPDHDTSVYGRSIEGGATVVTVKVAAAQYDRVAAMLEKHNPIDIDERSAQYAGGKVEPARTGAEAGAIGASGMTARPAAGVAGAPKGVVTNLGARGEETIQLAEEQLTVGKRAVEGGTTRIRRFVTSKPVEENVTLHSEKVVLDRRPVTDGRVLGAADFTDKTISMTATNEEAVVSKTARVVEEIGLHKEASDRVETIRDTVRRDEVEVVEDPSKRVIGSTTADKVERKI